MFSPDPSEFLSFDFEKSNVKWKEINQNKSIFGLSESISEPEMEARRRRCCCPPQQQEEEN
jgi:hypothetical protein